MPAYWRMSEVGHERSIANMPQAATPERGIRGMRVRTASVLSTVMSVACLALLTVIAAGAPPAVIAPPGWPATLQLGMSNSPGDASQMRATAPFGVRCQDSTGGANRQRLGHLNTTAVGRTTRGSSERMNRSRLLHATQSARPRAPNRRSQAHMSNAATMTAYYTISSCFQRGAPSER